MSDTSAPLLVTAVIKCCQMVISEIELSRETTMMNIVRSKLGTKMYWDMNALQILAALPECERMIPGNIRAAELGRVRAILELAEAIGGYDDMRMQVSLEDFQWLKKFYQKRPKQ